MWKKWIKPEKTPKKTQSKPKPKGKDTANQPGRSFFHLSIANY
jgi:hypothetical protein